MQINFKKVLLTGTAIVAVGTFASKAQAAQQVLTGAGQWASAGTHGGTSTGAAADAAAGNGADLQDFVLTVKNTNPANDSTGPNAFVLGTIVDTAGTTTADGLTLISGTNASDETIGLTSAVIGGAVLVNNTATNTNSVTVTDAGGLTSGSITLTDSAASAKTIGLSVGGTLSTGAVSITGGSASGATSTLTLAGASNTTTGISLTDNTGGASLALTTGGVAQAIGGTVSGSASNNGTVTISGGSTETASSNWSSLKAVTLSGATNLTMSGTSTLGATTITTGTGTLALGTGTLTATTLSLGGNFSTGGAVTTTNTTFNTDSTATFNGTTAQTIAGAVAGAAATDGHLLITNTSGGGVTFSGALSNLDNITIGVNNTNVTSTFDAAVTTTNGITLGDGGNHADTDTAVFDTTGGSFTVGGVVAASTAGTADLGNVTIQGGNTVTAGSNWGATTGSTGALNALAINGAGTKLKLQGNLTVGTITGSGGSDNIFINGNDSTITTTGATTGVTNINVGSANTLTLAGAGGITGGTINLLVDGSTVNVTGAKTISSAITGLSTGTQTLDINNNVTLSGAVTLVDAIAIGSGDTLTTSGGITGGTITYNAGGATLAVTGGTVTSTVTGGVGSDTLNLAGGATLSGGSVDLGAGTNNLTLGAGGATVSETLANVGSADLGAPGRILTLNSGGIISGLGTTTGTGINLDGGTLRINSGGSIGTGEIHGTGTLEFGNSGTGTFNIGGVVDGAALTVTNGTLSTNGHVLGANAALGAISVAAPATFNVQDNVTSGAALASNLGTIAISAGKTLTVASVTGAPTGTFSFELDKTAGVETNGTLHTGGALDLTDATVAVTLKSGSQPLLTGDVFTLSTGAASVTLPSNPVEHSFQYNYVLSDVANNLTLTVTTTAAATQDESSNDANTVRVLTQDLNGSTNPQIVEIQTNLSNATTEQATTHIIEATQPTVDGSTSAASFQVADSSFGLTGDRIASLRDGSQTGMAAGSRGYGLDAWGEGFGQSSNQGERDGIDGYTAHTFGGAAGIDTQNISDKFLLGAAFSYGRTDAHSKDANDTRTTVDSYQGTLYGNYMLDKMSYLDGMVGYGWNKNKTDRHDVGGVAGLDASGNFNSDQVSARAEAGRHFDVIGNTVLTPNLLANWSYYDPQSYTETGAGGADLHVDGKSQNLVQLGAGVKAGWTFKDANGSQILPEVRAGYRYAVVNDAVEDTANFTAGGGTFATNGAKPGRNSLDLGTTLKFLTTNNWDLSASYDFDYRADYVGNAGFVRAAYKF